MNEINDCCRTVQQVYTVEQIAEILNVSIRKAYYLCEETNCFIVKRLGKRCLRVNKKSFDDWLNATAGEIS